MSDVPSEHIYVPQASIPLSFTGERLTSSIESDITFEHWHRYVFAEQICRGKDVLDLASGEGYGSSLLATKARRVIGIDIDFNSVKHAGVYFKKHNLQFIQGSALDLPILSDSLDVVVSFETLEHIDEHEKFLKEIKRVLRKDGLLIISTPNAALYSGPFQPVNPHHKRELLPQEFINLIDANFNYKKMLGQSSMNGNVIVPLQFDLGGSVFFNQNIDNRLEIHKNSLRSMYFIAIASDDEILTPPVSFFNAAYYHAKRSVQIDNLLTENKKINEKIAEDSEKLNFQKDNYENVRDQLLRATAMLEVFQTELSCFKLESTLMHTKAGSNRTDDFLSNATKDMEDTTFQSEENASVTLPAVLDKPVGSVCHSKNISEEDLSGKTLQAHLNLASNLVGIGNVFAAAWEYRRALEYQFEFTDPIIKEAWIQLSNESFVEALETFKRCANNILPNRDVLITAALLERLYGDTYAGHPFLIKALNIWPDDAALNYQTGYSYVVQNNRPAAISYYKKAIACDPLNAEYLFALLVILNDLGFYEDVLEYYNNTLTISDPYMRQWGTGYVGHARVAKNIDHKSFIALAHKQQQSDNWLSAQQIWSDLREAIVGKKPFSLVRLGDGEGRFLFRDDPDPSYCDRDRTEFSDTAFLNWFARSSTEFSYQERMQLRQRVSESIATANVLGLPMSSRIEVDFQNLGYLWFLQEYIERETKKYPFILANCFINVDIHKLDPFYSRLLEGCKNIGIISCHRDIGVSFSKRLNMDVQSIVISGEKGQPNLPTEAREGVHYPDQYLSALKLLSKTGPGEVWLVAAGLLGKIYCAEVKRRGGVAIDIGSLADAWMGHNTRAGHYEDRAEFALS